MNNQEILEKAIQKANQNGWKKTRRHSGIDQAWMIDADNNPSLEELIFNHDFAKAMWGEFVATHNGKVIDVKTEWSKHIDDKVTIKKMGWQYHLQQMVIADDPIKYLGENL